MSTFFTPMDSDNSEDEDVSRKQGDTRKWSKSSEMFMCVTNLTLDEVSRNIVYVYIYSKPSLTRTRG